MEMYVAIVDLKSHKQAGFVHLPEWNVYTTNVDRANEVARTVSLWARSRGLVPRRRGDDENEGDLFGWTRGKMVDVDDWTWETVSTDYAWMVLPDL